MLGVDQDAKGNQTFIPSILRRSDNSLTLSWDFENKLTSADTDEDGQADVTYQWDALLRRVARTAEGETTVFAPSGQQTVADYRLGDVPATAKHTYVFGSYIDEPILRGGEGGLRYYHRNQQYSVVALTDGGGLVKERYAYNAYGEPAILDASGSSLATSAENNRYTYTGREWDESLGLFHYRARMYDPAGGRFVSRDPLGYADGLALHQAYFGTAGMDPLGQRSWTHQASGVLEKLHRSGQRRQHASYYGMEYSSKMDISIDGDCNVNFGDFEITYDNYYGDIFNIDHFPIGIPKSPVGGLGISIEQDVDVEESTKTSLRPCTCANGESKVGYKVTKSVKVIWQSTIVLVIIVDAAESDSADNLWQTVEFDFEVCPCCPCEYVFSQSITEVGPHDNGGIRTQHGGLLGGNWHQGFDDNRAYPELR